MQRGRMKKVLNNKGYSLLIAICALLIFSVIGISLLTMTTSGLKKNESREAVVLATDLADKGTQFIVSDLQMQLETMIKEPMGKVAFGKALDNMLGYNSTTQTLTNVNKNHCSQTEEQGIKINSASADNYTNVCISNVEMIKTNGTILEEDRYKRLVTIKSTGVADGKVHETFTKVIFGTDAIPDQLKYAVSSNAGSVHLYGGVEIRGDIKSAADITLHNEGYLLQGTDVSWASTVYPRLLPAINTVSPKIILPNNRSIYQNKINKPFSKESEILNLNVANNLTKYNVLNLTSTDDSNYFQTKALFASPTVNVVNRAMDADNIDVKNTIQEVYNKKTYNTFKKGNVSLGSKSDTSEYNKGKTHNYLISNEECSKNKCSQTKANLTINDSNLTISGQYYINGNVTINNATLYSDAILYVDGNVDIRNSQLYGKTQDSTLIIFATGKIFLANISAYKDTPSVVKGFFYSKDVVNLFGVISNMELHGGISGKSIILSGLRGKYTSGGAQNSVIEQKKLDQNGVSVLNPRLKLIYDENLIQSYTSFKRDEEEEFITTVSEPEIVEVY